MHRSHSDNYRQRIEHRIRGLPLKSHCGTINSWYISTIDTDDRLYHPRANRAREIMITNPLSNIYLLTIYSFLLLAASSSSWRQYYESHAFSLLPPFPSSRLSPSSTTSSMLFLSTHLQTTPLAPPKHTLKQKRPTLLQRIRLKFNIVDKKLREQVVHTYFHGVHTKNISQIINCFSDDGTIIRDVCNLQSSSTTTTNNENQGEGKLVSKEFLGERCNEFLMAHPNTVVKFHYG